MNWVRKIKKEWKWQLELAQSFDARGLGLDGLDFRSLKGELLARARGGVLTIYPRYQWDGCTVIGRIIETKGTLRASLLHDFLYQIAEQAHWEEPFTQRQADVAFRELLPLWAKWPWYGGVRLFGWAFYGGNEDSLIITQTK